MSEYYNEERKQRFIEERYPTNATAAATFKCVAPFEEKLKKDASEFSNSEAEDLYKWLKKEKPTMSMSYVTHINFYLEAYTGWCALHHWTKNNPYKRFTWENLKQYAGNGIIITPAQIESYRMVLKNPIDRVLVTAPFYGFRMCGGNYTDLADLTKEDINMRTGMVHLADRDIDLSENVHLIEDIMETFDTYEYVSENQRTTQRYALYGDGLFKYRTSEALLEGNPKNLVDNKFRRALRGKFHDPKLTYQNIYRSGIIYYTHRAQDHGSPALKQLKYLWDDEEFQREVITRFGLTKDKQDFYQKFHSFLS